MSIVKLYSSNPTDGTTTFDQIRFYQANDSSGTGAAVVHTSDIDTTTVTPLNPGFTSYIYSSGDTTKYYASTFYNSTSTIETDKSDWVLGGQDRWDTMFMNELQDTTSAVWSATDREYFKKKALEALYPEFFRNVIDTSLTVVNDPSSNTATYIYTVPFGIFSLSEVGYGNLNTTSSTVTRDFKVLKRDYWKFEKNNLHLQSLSGMDNGDTIRLIAQKKYLEVGEVPEYLDPLAMEHMRMSAYIKLADDYPRFLTWAKLQQGTKVSFENVRVHAREFERRFTDMKKLLKDTAMPTLL